MSTEIKPKKSRPKKGDQHQASQLRAKKDFLIVQNDYRRAIRAGEDIADVPSRYHDNLRTEGVL